MKNYLSLIKFSHTIFAMPFALVGFTLGLYESKTSIDWRILLCIVLCMIFARSAAMAFNRYLDRDIDMKNPRTVVREIPAGIIAPSAALSFVVINSLLFIATTWFINLLCFFLSPIALLVILGYSYTKRFTFLCHFVLGLGLALAPLGAYLAVTGHFSVLPIMYSAVVLLWVSGFDIIYALQDEEFDKSLNLNSVPVKMGKKGALQLSNFLHFASAIVLFLAVWMLNTPEGISVTASGVRQEGVVFGWIHLSGAIAFIALLFYQHTLVKVNDLSKVNLAFFTTNGIASVIYGSFFIIDYLF